MSLKPNEYQCVHCRGVFNYGWSDEDANAEALTLWGVKDASANAGMAQICDPCFQRMIREIPPEEFLHGKRPS